MTNIVKHEENDGLVSVRQTDGGMADMFAQMSKEAQERRRRKTPKQFAKQRQGKSGKTFTYVDRRYVEQWLDANFPVWSFDVVPDSVQSLGNHVHVAGRLSVMDKSGATRTVTSYGAKEAIPSASGSLVDHPYLKSAESDALKRCAAVLGCASDVYSGDVIVEEEPIKVCSAEDLRWFLNSVCTVLEQTDDTKLFNIPKQLAALVSCKLTKQQIQQAYAKQNITI
jgi:Rad52/22 family double-strand break repair protein